MEPMVETSWTIYLVITGGLFGWAALMTGQALAATWRSPWFLGPYSLLLAAGSRFIAWSLYDGDLGSVGAFALAVAILLPIALISYRLEQVRRMVRQYPWLYEPATLFTWRDRGSSL